MGERVLSYKDVICAFAMEKGKSYTELNTWKGSRILVKLIYELVSGFPKEELYGISSQIKRSAISVPSNIAEGELKTRLEQNTIVNKLLAGFINHYKKKICPCTNHKTQGTLKELTATDIYYQNPIRFQNL
jgi:hypothetical protein